MKTRARKGDRERVAGGAAEGGLMDFPAQGWEVMLEGSRTGRRPRWLMPGGTEVWEDDGGWSRESRSHRAWLATVTFWCRTLHGVGAGGVAGF